MNIGFCVCKWSRWGHSAFREALNLIWLVSLWEEERNWDRHPELVNCVWWSDGSRGQSGACASCEMLRVAANTGSYKRRGRVLQMLLVPAGLLILGFCFQNCDVINPYSFKPLRVWSLVTANQTHYTNPKKEMWWSLFPWLLLILQPYSLSKAYFESIWPTQCGNICLQRRPLL